MQPPSLVGFYALRATRSAEEAVCLSPHLPRLFGPAGLGTSRRRASLACRRLPRFLRASSLHRSRCELALEPDAKTAGSSPSRVKPDYSGPHLLVGVFDKSEIPFPSWYQGYFT